MFEDYERDDLLEMKRAILKILPDLEMDIMFYPLDANDEDYIFLLKKGAYYRDILIKIEQRLKEI